MRIGLHPFRKVAACCRAVSVCLTLLACAQGRGQEWTPLERVSLDAAVRRIPLEAPASEMLPAAGGRLMIVRRQDNQGLLVFDVAKLAIRGAIPLDPPTAMVVAGLDHLLIVDPNTGECQKWSLHDLSLNLTQTIAADLPIRDIALGASSRGPVVVLEAPEKKYGSFDDVRILSLDTLEPAIRHLVLAPLDSMQRPKRWDRLLLTNVSAADIGDSFVFSGSPVGLRVVDSIAYAEWLTGGTADWVIGPAGDTVFGAEAGDWNWQLKSEREERRHSERCWPTHSPHCFIDSRGIFEPTRIFLWGNVEPLGELPADLSTPPLSQKAAEQLLQIIPQAGLMLRLVADEILAAPFDIEQLLQQRQREYLFITNSPQRAIEVGTTFRWQPVARSDAADVSWTLPGGPEGMTVSDTGLAEWEVPMDHADRAVRFTIRAEGESGSAVTREFSLFCHRPAREYESDTLHNAVQPRPAPTPEPVEISGMRAPPDPLHELVLAAAALLAVLVMLGVAVYFVLKWLWAMAHDRNGTFALHRVGWWVFVPCIAALGYSSLRLSYAGLKLRSRQDFVIRVDNTQHNEVIEIPRWIPHPPIVDRRRNSHVDLRELSYMAQRAESAAEADFASELPRFILICKLTIPTSSLAALCIVIGTIRSRRRRRRTFPESSDGIEDLGLPPAAKA